MKKRVLLVARILDSRGAPTHMFALAQGLISIGWEVAIATGGQVSEHSHGPQWFESNGIPHFSITFPDSSLTVGNLTRVLKAYSEMESIVKQFKPNVIHVHYPSTSIYVKLIQLFYQIPFVATIHIAAIPTIFVYRIGSFWGDRTIAISSDTHKYLTQKFQVPLSKIRTVYNGVNECYFRPPTEEEYFTARQTFGINSTEKVVAMIARLIDEKGHDVLIKALALLRSQGCDVIALLAGEGPRAKELAQLASEAGVADLVRQIGYADSRQVLWASDISVLPSLLEGFPLVTVESMLCGVAHIRTPAAGAYDQIEDGVNGFVIPFDDYEALAKRLQQLLSDQELRSRISANALVTARSKFTQQIMVEKTAAVYEEVL